MDNKNNKNDKYYEYYKRYKKKYISLKESFFLDKYSQNLVNKNKYISLKNAQHSNNITYGGGPKPKVNKKPLKINNFYFVQDTHRLENLISILNDGEIKLGKDVDEKCRKWTGEQPKDYIYTNIYFEDLKNMENTGHFAFILHPKIVNDRNWWFNKNWLSAPSSDEKYTITFNKNDSNKIHKQQLRKIKKFLKNPSSLPDIVQTSPGQCHHEILFDKPISVKNYMIGIVCSHCNGKQLDQLEKLVKKKGYNIKIINENYPMPKLSDLVGTT